MTYHKTFPSGQTLQALAYAEQDRANGKRRDHARLTTTPPRHPMLHTRRTRPRIPTCHVVCGVGRLIAGRLGCAQVGCSAGHVHPKRDARATAEPAAVSVA